MIIDNSLHHCDCLRGMKHLQTGSIDLTCTSPPYGYGENALRTYKGHGFDWTEEKFKLVAQQLYRVTAFGGAVCWVVQDRIIKGEVTGDSWNQVSYFRSLGFRLHEWICLNKTNPFPHSPNAHRRHNMPPECLFVLVKGRLKTFNPLQDKPNKPENVGNLFRSHPRNKDGGPGKTPSFKPVGAIGYRSSVWTYSAYQQIDYTSAHPARMKPELARDIILTWSNQGDVVFDPFAGVATTLVQCIKTGRYYIGFEIHKPYVIMARQRIEDTLFDLLLEE